MLHRLSISNVALIEKLELDFQAGFSVLTGETGAGKSIIIEALNFVLGERASRELIQSGAKKAAVEAAFHIAANEPVLQALSDNELAAEDGELVLYREFSESGKSVCRANGTLISAAVLKQLGDALVDIHGQHEHQALLNARLHIRMLDNFGGESLLRLKASLAGLYARASAAEKQLKAAEIDERERERRCDLLSYQMAEIDKAALSAEEEAALLEQRGVLQNAQAIMEALAESAESLSGEESEGALQLLSRALRRLDGIADFHTDYAALRDRLQEAYYVLEDAGYSLRSLRDGFSFEPGALDNLEWRLETIASLKRKYGDSIEEILRYRERIGEEYELLMTSEQRREALLREYEAARDAYSAQAAQLSALRVEAGERLRARLLPELHDLGMPHAVFELRIGRLGGETPSAEGVDTVEFMLSTNMGEPVKPLARVASGGEISRIMLAFKSVLAGIDGVPTMIFDEIDSGVSGQIGTAVADKMRQLAGTHQVFSITHLPQIAAKAQWQYLVYKRTLGERTLSAARLLGEEERVRELARIMGGT
ncbi:MAG: DNA repair protein RecN, partial [Clostridia bacterium]|nr:DNA repair protein RecN [Clostridia bacterium]